MTPDFLQPADAPDGTELEPGLLDAYRQLTSQIDELQAARDQIRARIEAVLGDNETGLIDGRPAVTWSWGKPPVRLDSKRLKREQPEIWQAYAVTGQPSRSFRLVEQGGDR